MSAGKSLVEAHRQALDWTGSVVAAIRDDQWGAPTPCDEWNVHDLVNHLVAGNWWAGELASGATIDDVGDRLDGDLIVEGPHEAFVESAAASVAAFGAPGALEAPCAVSYGPVPGEVYLGHRFVDVLVHGWDLAVATGQPTELAPDLVDIGLEVVEPQAALLVASGAFAAVDSPSGDASAQERLLALVGRRA